MIRSYIEVIKNVPFRKLWLAQITSQIGLNMLSFVLAIRVYQETHSNTAVSLMLLSFAVPSIIFGVIAGGLVDYFDKRSILIFCNFSRLIILIAFFLFSGNIYMLFLLTVLISVITQFFIPAEAPAIANLVNKKGLLTANSLFTVTFYLSSLLGFILAGPVLAGLGNSNVYLFISFLMGAATIFVYFLPKIQKIEMNKNLDLNFSFISLTIREGIRFINSNERVKQSLILLTFSQALIATLAVLAPGFADRLLSIDLKDSSYLVMGPAAIGLVIGALWVGGFGNKFLKGSIILVGLITVSASLILLSFVTRSVQPVFGLINNLHIAMFLLFILGISNSFISVPANTILQADSQVDLRGRVYGVLTSMTGGMSFLPVVFSGILADVIGVGRTLSIIGLTVLVIGIYHYLQRQNTINLTSVIKNNKL